MTLFLKDAKPKKLAYPAHNSRSYAQEGPQLYQNPINSMDMNTSEIPEKMAMFLMDSGLKKVVLPST